MGARREHCSLGGIFLGETQPKAEGGVARERNFVELFFETGKVEPLLKE